MSVDKETDLKNNNYIQWESARKRNPNCTCTCHDPLLRNKSENKVTFCDNPVATENSVEQTETYSEILILDSPPFGHKPINRSVSLESRDNPFIPGGSLDQEAADILKRATIIRDQFILSDSDAEQKIETINAIDSSETNYLCQDSKTEVVEEQISPQSINGNQALPVNKQNGKVEEKHSPTDSQGMDIKKEGTLDRTLKDKKKQKKCCSLM